MMKLIFFCFLVSSFFTDVSYGQATNNQRYFVQSMVSEAFHNPEELANELRTNPYVYVVRYDQHTRGLLVVTKEIDFVLTTDVFFSWAAERSQYVNCVRVGLQSVDAHLPFPLTNCGE
jgi:hypothetical protein